MKHANISIFVPHNGCPNQCSFCNQKVVTGQERQPNPEDVRNAVEAARESLGRKSLDAEIAFFGGSFTAIDRRTMVAFLEAAAPYVQDGTVRGIRVSTRPDAVDQEILSLLKHYGVTAIELGAQSMDDNVLKLNRRGHTAKDVSLASELIRKADISLGLQMMTGLYGDTTKGSIDTARKLAALHPDTMRIYPTVTLKGTDLERLYDNGEYHPPSLEETVELCAELLHFFETQGIRVIRLGLHSTPDLDRNRVAGPWHPAFGELCQSRLFVKKLLESLKTNQAALGESITVFVSSQDISRAIGQKKENLRILEKNGYRVKFVAHPQISQGSFSFYNDQEKR